MEGELLWTGKYIELYLSSYVTKKYIKCLGSLEDSILMALSGIFLS